MPPEISEPSRETCKCLRGEQKTSSSVCDLDPAAYEDADLIWVYRCNECGRLWLRVLYEQPAFSRSGHWYDALLPDNEDLTEISKKDIKDIFLDAKIKLRGGSYWNGTTDPYLGIPKRIV